MSNRRISNSFLTLSVSSASSEATSFPKENIIDRTSPQRAWRTTVTTDSNIVIDLGSNQTALTVYLDNCNFTTVKYQESASSGGSWADVGSNLTISKDPMQGIYRRIDNLTLTSKRYLRIWIPSQTPVNGESYLQIGTLCCPTSILEPDFPETEVGFPFEQAIPETNIIENRFPTGGIEKIKLGNLQPMIISLVWRTTVNTNITGSNVQQFMDMVRDPTNIIFLDMNLGQSNQAWLVKKSGEIRASLNEPAVNTLEYGSILFEVVI